MAAEDAPEVGVTTSSPVLVSGAALGAYGVGAGAGYGLGTWLDRSFVSEDGLSDIGLVGLVVGGSLASGAVAHWLSAPGDPAWRTVAGALAAGGAAVLLLTVTDPDSLYSPGVVALPVVLTVSASVALSFTD